MSKGKNRNSDPGKYICNINNMENIAIHKEYLQIHTS